MTVKSYTWTRFCLAISLIILSLFTALGAQEKIILTSQNLSPLGSYDERGNYDGIAVKVVRYALEKMKIKYEILVYPWARAQNEVKIGKADGFFAGSKNEERESYAVMSSIIADQKWIWYLLKDNSLNPKSPEFKAKARVGAYLGTNMLDWLTQNGFTINATPSNTESLFKMLLEKRVDAIMANDLVAEEIIRKTQIATLLKQSIQQEQPLGVYFSKQFIQKYPKFLTTFNFYIKEYFTKYPKK